MKFKSVMIVLLLICFIFVRYRYFKNPLPLLKKVTNFFEQDIDFYRMVINTQGAPNFIMKLKETVIEKILSSMKTPNEIHNSEEYKMYVYRVHYLAGRLTSMY